MWDLILGLSKLAGNAVARWCPRAFESDSDAAVLTGLALLLFLVGLLGWLLL